jgi:hypothetical protein
MISYDALITVVFEEFYLPVYNTVQSSSKVGLQFGVSKLQGFGEDISRRA